MDHILIKQTVAFPKISFKTNPLLIKIMVKLRTIVILQVNIEVLHLAYVIRNIVNLKTFVWFFTTDLAMITILS